MFSHMRGRPARLAGAPQSPRVRSAIRATFARAAGIEIIYVPVAAQHRR
jgi:hypothetical protein